MCGVKYNLCDNACRCQCSLLQLVCVSAALSSVPLLIDEQLTTSVLSMLHNLTQFENLQPRFNAMVPSCWTEIQQEQQQRKHPQHLHQKHGDASLHTRTWRLQPDRYSVSVTLLSICQLNFDSCKLFVIV